MTIESKVERSGIRTVPTTGASVSGRFSASRKIRATGTGPSRERRAASSLRSKGEVAGRVTASSGFRHNSRKVGGNASPKRRQSGEAGCNIPPIQAIHLSGMRFLQIGGVGADLSECGKPLSRLRDSPGILRSGRPGCRGDGLQSVRIGAGLALSQQQGEEQSQETENRKDPHSEGITVEVLRPGVAVIVGLADG